MHLGIRRTIAALLGATVLSGCASLPWAEQPDTGAVVTRKPSASLPVQTAVVKTKSPVALTGARPTTIVYEAPGDYAVVAKLDCSQCTGPVKLSSPQRGQPWVDSKKPVSGSYLMNILKFEREGELTIEADGLWELTLMSWKDLKPVSQVATTKGSKVVLLKNKLDTFRLTYKPADKSDRLQMKTFPMPKTNTGFSTIFETNPPKSTVLDLNTPVVVSVYTRGKWSLTPFDPDAPVTTPTATP